MNRLTAQICEHFESLGSIDNRCRKQATNASHTGGKANDESFDENSDNDQIERIFRDSGVNCGSSSGSSGVDSPESKGDPLPFKSSLLTDGKTRTKMVKVRRYCTEKATRDYEDFGDDSLFDFIDNIPVDLKNQLDDMRTPPRDLKQRRSAQTKKQEMRGKSGNCDANKLRKGQMRGAEEPLSRALAQQSAGIGTLSRRTRTSGNTNCLRLESKPTPRSGKKRQSYGKHSSSKIQLNSTSSLWGDGLCFGAGSMKSKRRAYNEVEEKKDGEAIDLSNDGVDEQVPSSCGRVELVGQALKNIEEKKLCGSKGADKSRRRDSSQFPKSIGERRASERNSQYLPPACEEAQRGVESVESCQNRVIASSSQNEQFALELSKKPNQSSKVTQKLTKKRMPKKKERAGTIIRPGATLQQEYHAKARPMKDSLQSVWPEGQPGLSSRHDTQPSRGIDSKEFHRRTPGKCGNVADAKPARSMDSRRTAGKNGDGENKCAVSPKFGLGSVGKWFTKVGNENIRVTRSKKVKQNNNQVITIEDSSEEEELLVPQVDADDCQLEQISVTSYPDGSSVKRRRLVGDRLPLSVVRIAIGNKVFSAHCKMAVQLGTRHPFILLSFSGDSEFQVQEVKISLEDDSISEVKYYLEEEGDSDEETDVPVPSSRSEVGIQGQISPECTSALDPDKFLVDEKVSFIAMRVKPNERNGLKTYSSFYEQDWDCHDELNGEKMNRRQYIVVELRSEEDFKELLSKLQDGGAALRTFLESCSKLSASDVMKYTISLTEDTRKERERRLNSSPGRRTRSNRSELGSSLFVQDDKDVFLVYPFVGGDKVEDAAKGLLDGDGGFLIRQKDNVAGTTNSSEMTNSYDPRAPRSSAKELQIEATSGRTHYLTITREDRDRLEPMEFLNDTLVDFWMRWIWRKESASSSVVQFFTSHFFSTLRDEGVRAVANWTAKKGIDIFNKRFVFIPINESLHWSLCVVVNAGHIENSFPRKWLANNHGEKTNVDVEDFDDDEDIPCILFLDSLKAHKKRKVAEKITRWLNHEWLRLNKTFKKDYDDLKCPFNMKTMKVYDPRVPYQTNSWDCGVFVCLYAFALYQMRHRRLTYHDLEGGHFRRAITESDEFDFGMNEIVKMRGEMSILIAQLSKVYHSVKRKETEDKRNPKDRVATEPGGTRTLSKSPKRESKIVYSPLKTTSV